MEIPIIEHLLSSGFLQMFSASCELMHGRDVQKKINILMLFCVTRLQYACSYFAANFSLSRKMGSRVIFVGWEIGLFAEVEVEASKLGALQNTRRSICFKAVVYMLAKECGC